MSDTAMDELFGMMKIAKTQQEAVQAAVWGQHWDAGAAGFAIPTAWRQEWQARHDEQARRQHGAQRGQHEQHEEEQAPRGTGAREQGLEAGDHGSRQEKKRFFTVFRGRRPGF